MLDYSVYFSGIMIVITYVIYSIIGHFLDGRLILTIPFIIIAVLRQFQLSKLNHPLIQKNEFYKDKITAMILISYSLFTLILLYSDVYDMLIKS